ncbi:MAG: 3-dehydroquinate synthase [Thermodesulfovibrionales bacterium]
MKNIVLTGFMGTGKSEVGRLVAQKLRRRFVDLDSEIEREHGMSIAELFRTLGEEEFRNRETAAIRKAAEKCGTVISTGGGAVIRQENRDVLRRNGVLVCLTATPETILKRTGGGRSRPLLRVENPLLKIRELLESRRPYYGSADITIDTEGRDPGELAEEIIRVVSGCGAAAGPEEGAPAGAVLLKKRNSHGVKRGAEEESMEKVRVELGERSYDIIIGRGILPGTGESLSAFGFSPRAAVVSNPAVFSLYGPAVMESLQRAGFECCEVLIPDGEEYKDFFWSYHILTCLLKNRLDRNSCVIALGGGVIGDITGFAASLYMRGLHFVQIPTTLLAQVDSSVGGKTGVNHPRGKNMIGSFYQPRLVRVDLDTLKTLPGREFLSGIAEVIKYGVIRDSALFDFMERNRDAVRGLETDALAYIVGRSCAIKAEVVSRDERESGLRAILNFGHTVGHAVETGTGYSRYLHGEAVAIGMQCAARLAVSLGMLDASQADRIEALLEAYGLPSRLPGDLNRDALLSHMLIDKKAVAGEIRFVLPERIGQVRMYTSTGPEELRKALASL